MEKWIKTTIAKIVKNKFGVEKSVELTPSKTHADFATNISMKLTKELKRNPFEIATEIKLELEKENNIESVEVAGPGFINIFLSSNIWSDALKNIISDGSNFGMLKQGKKINIEFVSANPTGYLHVGHARGAAIGDTLANILSFAGNKVDREYYINDAGSQIDILGQAVFLRYQELLGKEIQMPENTYKGNDIIDIAKLLVNKWSSKYLESEYKSVEDIFKKEAKKLLLEVIKKDLKEFNVEFDIFFSEESLYESKKIETTLNKLKDFTFKEDDALWLKTIVKGDDKDRVLIKSDGKYTYLTPDIAYHNEKIKRGYDELINVWGADHSGYIKRMAVAIEYLGFNPDAVDTLVIQLVRLIKDGKELKMSKRLGTSFTLKELMELAGKDATRFYMINKSNNSKFDFDIDQATKKTSENPIFTIQYTHARATQLLDKFSCEATIGKYSGIEKELIIKLLEFPKIIEQITSTHKIHLLPKYLIDLTSTFNSFYSNVRIIDSDRKSDLLSLVIASKSVIKTALKLIGVSAPDRM